MFVNSDQAPELDTDGVKRLEIELSQIGGTLPSKVSSSTGTAEFIARCFQARGLNVELQS